MLEIYHSVRTVLISSIFVAIFMIVTPAFGQGVELTNIQPSPQQIHVGNSFRINATVVNNSPNVIYFNGGCQSPISATFDKNVVIDQAMGCLAIMNVQVKPGQNITISGPSATNLYTATSSGSTKANVTFSYQTGNKSNAISKIYTINILNGISTPEFPSIGSLIFAIASISTIFVMALKRNHNLFK